MSKELFCMFLLYLFQLLLLFRAHRQWMSDTFFLSNVSPQNPHFNRNAWNNLEKYTRSLVHHYDNVFVCTGPLYVPR